MLNTVINEFNIGSEVQELFWFAGTSFNAESACFIRPVLRGVESGNFHMCKQPIGMMPILTLGQYYQEGKLLNLSFRGEVETCVIPDLGNYEAVTSAEIPAALYSFNHFATGTQRLFKYCFDGIEVLIPSTELIRYLFIHNRALANAMLRSSGLMSLYKAIAPGYYDDLHIDFTENMPLRALSNRFAEEFAWAAVDPDARKSWDSIYRLSAGNEYLLFEPPPLKSSRCELRAIKRDNQILVLEILLLTGKRQPCNKLVYSHPSMKQRIRHKTIHGIDIDPIDSDKSMLEDEAQRYEYEHKLDNLGDGTTPNQNPKMLSNGLKRVSFDQRIEIKRLPNSEVRDEVDKPETSSSKPSDDVIKRVISISAGDVSLHADLEPIEFNLLTADTEADTGDLEIVAEVILNMATLVPERKFSLSYSRLKSGKAFSTVNRDPRLAAIAIVSSEIKPPICILDIDHSGGYALSLLAIRFKELKPLIELESVIQRVLDSLVDNNGHWDTTIEADLEQDCVFERFPKLLSPREDADHSVKSMIRAVRLASKLELLKKV